MHDIFSKQFFDLGLSLAYNFVEKFRPDDLDSSSILLGVWIKIVHLVEMRLP